MNEFSNIGNPALRKVAIDFYLKKANIQSTAEYEEKAGLLPDRAKNLDNLKKEADRIYGFNESNGTIRQAQDGEKALTRQQAEAMKADWLADHPKATNDPKDEAPKYIKNENTGMWMINPDAKNLTPGDYAYWIIPLILSRIVLI